jgi:hypothetical protein
MFSTIAARPAAAAPGPAAASPQAAAAGSAPAHATAPRDSFFWSGALALPDYVYGGTSAALSAATGFAARFPAGGVTINPGGIIQNPDWTRSFQPDSLAAHAQPILAGFAAAIAVTRGMCELQAAARRDSGGVSRLAVAGGLDLALGAASMASMVYPGVGGAISLGLFGARLMVDLLPAS